jgi:hypothetical protein
MVKQVEVDIGGELADRKELAVILVTLLELPVLVDRDHCARSHGAVNENGMGVELEKEKEDEG